MRVLESSPLGIPAMGKKKHKLRKQSKENDQCPSDSSDEANIQQRTSGSNCPHLTKAINFNVMKKAIKQLGTIGVCTTCERDEIKPAARRDGCSENASATITDAEPLFDDHVEPTIWVCVQCGHQGCDRNSTEKHALKHFQTPRSASHAVVVNVHTWAVWCYDCDDEVGLDSNRRLLDCTEYLRKQMGADPPPTQAANKHTLSRQDSSTASAESRPDETTSVKETKSLNQQNKSKTPAAMVNLPKVKGLSNLGNTCFFNAVMQNLSQTPYLEGVLNDRGQKGIRLRLEGHTCDNSSSEDSNSSDYDDEEKEERVSVEPITITIDECGSLTQCVIGFLRDMHSATRNSTISPSGLFGQVCRKAPRFKGFQQQDSHELLRHLLDGMKAEEIKRHQVGILKVFQLHDNGNRRKQVDEETKLKIKEYWRHAKRTFVDNVFGGYFISTVLCEECHVPSQIFEPFHDISLPITEEKPSRPNSLWGSRKKESKAAEAATLLGLEAYRDAETSKPSKHLLKKAKKQSRQKGKKKSSKHEDEEEEEEKEEKDAAAVEAVAASAPDNNKKPSLSKQVSREDQSNSNEESDADIEDNIESDVSRLSEHRAGGETAPLADMMLSGGDESHSLYADTGGSTTDTLSVDTTLSSASSVNKLTNSLTSLTLTERTDSVCSNELDNLNDEDLNKMGDDVHKCESPATCRARSKQQKLDAQLRATMTLAPRYQSSAHECSIMSCLHQFTSAELLTGNNKFRCNVCTHRKFGRQSGEGKKEMVYTNASKQVLICSPPAVLTLHLKRFQQVGFTLRKVNRHVDFPLILDLAPFTSAICQGVKAKQDKVLYSLYGVVEHSGRLTGGHYTAYVKVRAKSGHIKEFLQLSDLHSNNVKQTLLALQAQVDSEADRMHAAEGDEIPGTPPHGKWYYISDSRVTEANESSVLRCQAYLLFYERIC